ncbi:RimJ/RimL family protein N-acetyltransferase [Flavobacterium endophyticum]|uniref:RimJ/RimL family protein N-acetyltransferase n=1 Tax=Flavobacterium endophyticum TaxID=1540163 RepID=A0A495MLR5_9FLAO|nr:GNAT family protein [Flavobacterium endophyticum]RKS25279.1 RimJ/RimL family protein N-acetyltransferase [Flavobacterium endophyticum]
MAQIKEFDFSKEVILQDDAVLLRPLQHSDIENLLHFSLNEPEIWTFSSIPAAGRENLENYIDLALKARENKTEFPFIVYDKKTNTYAGSTRFYDINLPFKTLQLGYTWYGKDYQGTGLNKHCKFLMLEFAFEVLGMERVEFRADSNNAKSIAAMKSIGCQVEGILRSHMPTIQNGVRRDSIILSILKSEWEGGAKEQLKNKINNR